MSLDKLGFCSFCKYGDVFKIKVDMLWHVLGYYLYIFSCVFYFWLLRDSQKSYLVNDMMLCV